jgi:hypothetical protein
MTTVQPEEIGPGRAAHFCPECGEPTDGAKFCANCGHEMATAPRPASGPPPRLDPNGGPPNSSSPSGSGGASRRRMLLLIAGGAIAVAAVAVAVIVLSNGGGSKKHQTAVEAPQQTSPALAYQSQVVKALTPLVTANQSLSTALVALDGSKQATNHAKTAATQAATAISSARGGISVLTAPAAAGNLPGQVQQVLTADNGYLQAVGSTLQSPTVSGASQLDGLATGAQSAFDGISTIIPAAGSSVSGSNNLGNWARGAARPRKPKAQSSSSSSSSTPAAPAPAPAPTPAAPTPSGMDCGGGLIAGFATTCAFSVNVQSAWDEAPGETATVNAYSPATGRTYTEFCGPWDSNSSFIFCTDSDNSNSIWFPS